MQTKPDKKSGFIAGVIRPFFMTIVKHNNHSELKQMKPVQPYN
tara:strand:+ start:4901 stop:5029 length:129 start_codon:yes stop_codon:yes gene_type:complete